ncbi:MULTISPECIES: Gfo/Idh/MocA family protein [Bacillus cereus group]|uniref:Gfo/Idh/MocA family oxidoreductase n=2 Tax=Bacillus thuringiensis TaxID=1428 RepID=A0A9W3VGR3_BACTU|nr:MULTISPECIES: Gfo/Idh/MocA family oxidoreductase [Bacillus cereus group]AYF84941.1 gfo/Idh/MocA family oxidoreductase [Bacillus thuringiensis]MBJ8154299.1 Gfo/Idh/MocA family oxidoreductase [Bacillus cereus]MED2794833.1 Gfo/Idh/MocA family oxidoreductase [Bacillus wiedmannii]TBX46852.1 Gfo/Idh/MocA family oxidoreductase [Bacillus thuringiensis]
MNILKVGIIGCGSIAQHRHLPEYEANPYVQIVAVCDSNKKRAKEIANNYGVNMYTDYNELINCEELDAVSVCTPNHLHASISIAALQAGIHVLCEKPMATSKADAEMMIGAAEKSGKKLMIGHNQRFVASHQKAKQLIKSGAIGKIYSFRTAFGHSGPENWSVDGKESWFFKKEEAFLGAMGDLGVHKADLIRYILNEEITEVGAFVETSAKTFSNVDDCAVCILKSESGIIGTLAASWSYVSKEDNSTIIYGEKATLRLEDDPTNSLIIQYKNGEVVKYELNKIQSNATVGQSNSHVIEQFVVSILSDKEPLINGVDGMKSLEVILAAIQSSETKQIVTIPL